VAFGSLTGRLRRTPLRRNLIGGLIGAVVSTKRFAQAKFTLNGSDVVYGSTVTALINFLIVAAVIYFVIVVPMNELHKRRSREAQAATPAPSDEAVLLTEIRDLLRSRR